MTNKYKNVYIIDTSTVVGPYEHNGPLAKRFDRYYDDFYGNCDSLETFEMELMTESIKILLEKINKCNNDIDLFIAGDLQNQITSSCYTARFVGRPFLGIFSACASNTEGLIIAASMIDSGKCNNSLVSVSSHNMVAEKQFRNPTEYGAPRPNTATFTATGGASAYLSKEKGMIRIESSTIGKVMDLGQNNPNNSKR